MFAFILITKDRQQLHIVIKSAESNLPANYDIPLRRGSQIHFFLWCCDPTRVMASSFLRFLDHTQRRITVGRTPLDEWSACRRDLYLKTHNTYNRQTSMPPLGFEPAISAGGRPQTYALDRAASGTGAKSITYSKKPHRCPLVLTLFNFPPQNVFTLPTLSSNLRVCRPNVSPIRILHQSLQEYYYFNP